MGYVSDALIDSCERKVKRLQDENDALRKLARDWFLLYRDHEDMSFKDALGTEVVLWKRMVELKVEVSK